MVKEEITIQELLEGFKLKLKLSERLLSYIISSDFLKAELEMDKNQYIFSIDKVKLIINPKNKKETVQKYVYDNEDNIIGGIILNENEIQYLN
jgi:hypothetical protein